jgi:Clustered mitochondria
VQPSLLVTDANNATTACTITVVYSHKQGVRTLQGDGAAHKSAAHDLRNIALLSSLDVPDLYTLGTTIVDYLGCRLVRDLLMLLLLVLPQLLLAC